MVFHDDDEEPEVVEPGTSRACTPDFLLDFMLELGRVPTLRECKAKFRGFLAAMFCAWRLKEEGRWPRFK